MSAHEIAAPVLAALGGVSAAGVTGWFLLRREREARVPAEHASAVDGFDKLTARLDGEVARLSRDLTLVRQQLAAAMQEVDECERARRSLEARVAALEVQLVHAGVLERRRHDRGPDGPERRQQP